MRRRSVPWPTSAFLLFTFLSGHAFEARAQQGSSAEHRDRFASLLLAGRDPVAERARQRLGERRQQSPALAPTPFAVVPAAATSGPSGGPALAQARGSQTRIATGSHSVSAGSSAAMAVVAASRRRPSPTRSVSYLEQRAARLEHRSAQIARRDERLHSIRPVSQSEENWIEQTRSILAREERSALGKLGQIERQLASPTAPVAAVDPLGLGSVARARHPGGFTAMHREAATGRR